MEEKQTITTIKGTTYTRRKKPKELDTYIFVRLSKEMKDKLDSIVSKKNTTVAKISRDFFEKYIEENE
jgi:predicted DNA-binding protein